MRVDTDGRVQKAICDTIKHMLAPMHISPDWQATSLRNAMGEILPLCQSPQSAEIVLGVEWILQEPV